MRREQLEQIIIKTLRIAGIAFFVVVVAFPFYWMFVSSLKSLEEILLKPSNLGLDIRHADFFAYHEVLFRYDFVKYIGNILVISVFSNRFI